MANESSSDDTISLEELVRKDGSEGSSIAGAPVPTPKGEEEPPPVAAAPSPAPEAMPTGELDIAKIDDLLAEEDPAFAASLEELKGPGMEAAEVEIDPLDIDKVIADPSSSDASLRQDAPKGFIGRVTHFFQRIIDDIVGLMVRLKDGLIYLSKEGVKAGVHRAKDGLKAALESVKNSVSAFSAMKWTSKLLVLTIVVLAVALFFVVRLTFKGNYLPDMQQDFLNGFQDVADQVYEYDPREPMEDFQNPLLHPETVVLLEKMTVNLKQPGDGTNPMGMFEFYVETASREAAIELKDREVEAKDVISRTLEQMPYEELVTEAGKHKLKVIVRKNLNEFLTKGRVRKIFFKTVVLKP